MNGTPWQCFTYFENSLDGDLSSVEQNMRQHIGLQTSQCVFMFLCFDAQRAVSVFLIADVGVGMRCLRVHC